MMLLSNLCAELLHKHNKVIEKFLIKMKKGLVQFRVEANLQTNVPNQTDQNLTNQQ